MSSVAQAVTLDEESHDREYHACEYRVIEVSRGIRSIPAALDEYGHADWELAAFERTSSCS